MPERSVQTLISTSVWRSMPLCCKELAPKNNTRRNVLRKRGSKRKNVPRSRGNDMSHVASHPLTRFTPAVYGFPDKLVTSLRYHSIGSVTSASGAPGFYGFRWNSIFDPDFTSTGHQPLYRDTYAGIYDHYSVVSAIAIVRFTNANTATMLGGCVTDDDGNPSTTLDTLCEQSHGFHQLMTPLSGSKSCVTFNLKWDCKKVLGIDPYASETYKTAVAANPDEPSFLWLWASDATGGNSALIFDIELVQEVLFTELTTPTQS